MRQYIYFAEVYLEKFEKLFKLKQLIIGSTIAAAIDLFGFLVSRPVFSCKFSPVLNRFQKGAR